jgi:hypothetical protein
MSDLAAFVRPAAMESHGAYRRSSRVQAAGLSPAVPLLEQVAGTVALPSAPQPVVLADYGCSEGHNSLVPLGVAIGALRQRLGPERAIWVVHTDLADNDFTALFQTLATDPGQLPARGSHRIRLSGRQVILRAAPSLKQRHVRLELLGGAMAEPGAGANPRSGAGGLQPRFGRT